MEELGVLERFTRGCYFCKQCGIKKPSFYKYVEISMANPRTVICLSSDLYLNGILKEELEVVYLVTERTDRKKMELNFPVQRLYLQNTELKGEIKTEKTRFGEYRYYGVERSICDCLRMKEKIGEDVLPLIQREMRRNPWRKEEVLKYGKELRALKNVVEGME